MITEKKVYKYDYPTNNMKKRGIIFGFGNTHNFQTISFYNKFSSNKLNKIVTIL